MLHIDVQRFQQVLLNLITNANKFTNRAKIVIKCDLHKELPNTFIKVEVKDQGCGIKQQDISKLFQPFSMIESSRVLNPNGTGLGLNICK
jgi:signal transduction histidine kinase